MRTHPTITKQPIRRWILRHHIAVRVYATAIATGLMFTCGVSMPASIKWLCFFASVPLLTLAQLESSVWRVIFRIREDAR